MLLTGQFGITPLIPTKYTRLVHALFPFENCTHKATVKYHICYSNFAHFAVNFQRKRDTIELKQPCSYLCENSNANNRSCSSVTRFVNSPDADEVSPVRCSRMQTSKDHEANLHMLPATSNITTSLHFFYIAHLHANKRSAAEARGCQLVHPDAVACACAVQLPPPASPTRPFGVHGTRIIMIWRVISSIRLPFRITSLSVLRRAVLHDGSHDKCSSACAYTRVRHRLSIF
jgi:hypothetical protein